MTGAELKERCRNRNFDQIVVVVKDIFQKMASMQLVQKEAPGSIRLASGLLTGADGAEFAFSEKRAVYAFANTRIMFVEPVEGNTLYAQYLDRFGEGICCIRERFTPEEAEQMKQKLASKKIMPAQLRNDDKAQAVWFDLTEKLGILYEISCGEESEEIIYRSPARIAQINISTPKLQNTIEYITDVLEIGPWEVGRQCSAVAHDTAFTVGGELKDQDFAFLLAILVCGNIEWEVIEPEVGELVYSDYINRKGIGFHHILQEIPAGKWEERLDEYEKSGISLNCKGGLGPVDWCYMNTEKELGFFVELRTDAVMEKLPDGYLQYFYPED